MLCNAFTSCMHSTKYDIKLSQNLSDTREGPWVVLGNCIAVSSINCLNDMQQGLFQVFKAGIFSMVFLAKGEVVHIVPFSLKSKTGDIKSFILLSGCVFKNNNGTLSCAHIRITKDESPSSPCKKENLQS
ncbi:hypothetical protein M9H77_29002 [Catharanthus roseus]|uniref:Uncharacterized protein n=1 Tax=Catharanthus roseus TaxID=4058 RepID=A0ACC0AJ62_CATRO|nr:hypothetical protein M9H77_29002 [Catharanthus roseus]